MGLQIAEIVQKKVVEIEDLQGEVIVIDTFNILYQFLANIRQRDGTPLMDKKNRVTSHLSGLFYRTTNLLSQGLKLIFVFDGKAPEAKTITKEGRERRKEEARVKFETAKEAEEKLKYAKRMMKLTGEMIEESKELVKALGLPVVQAPEEGEAQAAYLCRKEGFFGVASQDYDSLLFSAPRLIQNLTLARRRKTISGFVEIKPGIITLHDLLNSLQINRDQLICLGILAGTDYNPKGIEGIGQKKALQIVKKYKYPVKIFACPEVKEKMDFDWQKIFSLFNKPKITNKYSITFHKLNKEKILQLLVKKHDFSKDRVESVLAKLEKEKAKGKQKKLSEF